MNSREVDINEIPLAVLQEVEIGLRHYFVPILALWQRRGRPELNLVGSGTLIEVAGRSSILTAGHVWGAVAGADTLNLLMGHSRRLVEIPVGDISAMTNWNSGRPQEWGPDLALLQIPPLQLATIKAFKSFLNFEKQKADLSMNPPKIEGGLWATYGVVGEFSRVSVDSKEKTLNAELVARAFFGGITQTHSRAEFDYYDTKADLWLPGVPYSFGGVSGGGLWQVDLSVSKSGHYSWDEKRQFRGVAFWQSSDADEQRIVRCHGPRSIFERGWNGFEPQ